MSNQRWINCSFSEPNHVFSFFSELNQNNIDLEHLDKMHIARAFAGQLEKLLGSLSALAYCVSGRLSMSASDTTWYLACLDYNTKVANVGMRRAGMTTGCHSLASSLGLDCLQFNSASVKN